MKKNRHEQKRDALIGLLMNRGRILAGIITLSVILFEIFSYASSNEALRAWFGDQRAGRFTWAGLIAFAFCAVDISAAPLLPKFRDLPYLVWAWILTAIGDTFLTFVMLSNSIASRPDPILVQAGVLSQNFWRIGVPIGFAVLIWMIQYLLMTKAETAVSDLLEEKRA